MPNERIPFVFGEESEPSDRNDVDEVDVGNSDEGQAPDLAVGAVTGERTGSLPYNSEGVEEDGESCRLAVSGKEKPFPE